MLTFQQYLEEGVNDPSIFKAIFMAGGPGSGKSYVSNQLGLKAFGYRPINVDAAFELIAKKQNFSLNMTDDELAKIEQLRNRAKEITGKQRELALMGRLGLLIDGTGKDYNKIKKTRDALKDLGYETYMVFVNTSLETAMDRNAKRSRSVPPSVVRKSWQEVQKNLGKFQSLFGTSNFSIVDNDGGSVDVNNAYRSIMKFSKSSPRSKEAKEWIKNNV